MKFLAPWLHSRGWVSLCFIEDGQIIPSWFGVAFYDFASQRALVLPIPINLIVGALWRLRCWAKNGIGAEKIAVAFEAEYERGRRDERERFLQAVEQSTRDIVTRYIGRPQ